MTNRNGVFLTLSVALAAACAGAFAAVAALVVNEPLSLSGAWAPFLAVYAVGFGALAGLVLGPAATAWLLRDVPLWKVLAGCTLGTLAGAAAGSLLPAVEWLLAGGVAGFTTAVVLLREGWRFRTAAAVRWGVAAVVTMAALAGAGLLNLRQHSSALLREALALDALPSGIRLLRCADYGFTDVLTTCSFRADPAITPLLLSERAYSFDECDGQVSRIAPGPSIGPDFRAGACWEFVSPEFPLGPTVRILSDGAGRYRTTLYIE